MPGRPCSGEVKPTVAVQTTCPSTDDLAQRYRLLLDNARDIILFVLPDGHIAEANQAAVLAYGYSLQELLSKTIYELRAPSASSSDRPGVDMANLKSSLFETIHRRKDGTTFPVEVSSQVATLDGQTVALSIVRDISERRRADEALAKLDRMKDQFITVAAHELKTPVAVMKGYAQLLLSSRSGLTTAQRMHLEAIYRGSDRINRIIDDLLEISRFQLGRIQLHKDAFRLDQLICDVVHHFASTFKTHRIVAGACRPVTVRGDATLVERVVAGIIDNAVRYSPGSSEVLVEIVVRDDEAIVSITDHGVGIPREKQSGIGEPFFRAHTGTPWDYGGMGVGLHIARETITMHGGRLWFESEEHKGSSFHFSLPMEDHNDPS